MSGISQTKDWKCIATVGRELDSSVGFLGPSFSRLPPREHLKAWSPVAWEHQDSCFGFTGYLPQKDFNAWDKERAGNPERTWPADGAVSKLYDFRRKGKPAWKPTTYVHKGRCFPLEAPLLPGQRLLLKPKRQPKTRARSLATLFQDDASASALQQSMATCGSPRSLTSQTSHASHASSTSVLTASRKPSKPPAGPAQPLDRRRKSEPGKVWNTFGEVLEGR